MVPSSGNPGFPPGDPPEHFVFAPSACTAAGAVAAVAAAQATDHRTAIEAPAGSLGKRDTDSPAPDADSRIASVNC